MQAAGKYCCRIILLGSVVALFSLCVFGPDLVRVCSSSSGAVIDDGHRRMTENGAASSSSVAYGNRILYIVTTLAEYNTGKKANVVCAIYFRTHIFKSVFLLQKEHEVL